MEELTSSMLVKTIRPQSAQESIKQQAQYTPIHTPYLLKRSQNLKPASVVVFQQTPTQQQPQIQKQQPDIIDIRCFDLCQRQRPNSAQIQFYKKKLYTDIQYSIKQKRQQIYDSIRYDLVDNNYVKYNSCYDNRVVDFDEEQTEFVNMMYEGKSNGTSFLVKQLNTIELKRGKKQTPDLVNQLVINIKVYPPRKQQPAREKPYDTNRLFDNFRPYSKIKPGIERMVIGHKWCIRSQNLQNKMDDIQHIYQAQQHLKQKQQTKNCPMFSTKIFD